MLTKMEECAVLDQEVRVAYHITDAEMILKTLTDPKMPRGP